MVSGLTMSFICVDLVVILALFIVPAIVLFKKYRTSWAAFGIGCATFVIFALVLEQILHTVVLASPLGETIQNTVWMYALYGGLAAGVFEEVGRLVAMKFCLKKQMANNHNALMYGAGHGGVEALIIVGLTMFNNIVYCVMINTGMMQSVLDAAPSEASREQLQAIVTQLVEAPSSLYLVAPVERVSAILLHIALSVLVWIAVKNRQSIYFIVAIIFHTVVDAVTVIVNANGVNYWVLEAIVFAMSVVVALVAYMAWKDKLTDGIPADEISADEIPTDGIFADEASVDE